jgi:hypothetical protein
MAKFEAVDRLMDMAMEKRADRVPGGTLPEPAASESAAPESSSVGLSAGHIQTVTEKGGSARAKPSAGPAGSTSADRGRQFLHSLRPLLPAVAGAMRLVDHGAVQALAHLLPLLGGSAQLQPAAPSAQEQEAREQWLRFAAELQAAQQTIRKELQDLTLKAASQDERLGRIRTQLDRMVSEQSTRDTEVRGLADRVRLLSAGMVVLVMLTVAQLILFLVMFYK